jgi:hypothetical protein
MVVQVREQDVSECLTMAGLVCEMEYITDGNGSLFVSRM